jgi:parallel beta-helix repeat protein
MRSPLAFTFAFALLLSPSLIACGDNEDGDDDGADDADGTDDDGGDDAPSDACGEIEGRCVELSPGDDDQTALQTALIEAEEGDVILLHAGTYSFTSGLSLDVAGVTVRGEGEAETILSFAGQTDGAEGLLVTADNFTCEDLAVEDTAGDAIKVEGADNIIFRGVRTEWTGKASDENGAYGIYPVQCTDVLIEDSIVRGASDAGIYVGQTERAVVRRNTVEGNVAGIEIENTNGADVYENTATGNTGGILVFNLPGLQLANGVGTRVYDNEIFENNGDNFAAPGTTVSEVPPGTGVMVLAAHEVEVFNNTISDNQSANVLIISYLVVGEPNDDDYDPYPDVLYFHDNEIVGGGTEPSGDLAAAWALLELNLPEPPKVMPDFVFDGVLDPARTDEKTGEYLPEFQICIQANGDADFVNLDFANTLANPSLDAAPHDCEHAPVAEVVLDGVTP